MFKLIKQYLNNFQHSTISVIEVRDSFLCCYVFNLLDNYSDYNFQGSWHVASIGFKAGKIDNVKLAVDSFTKLLNLVESALDVRLKQVIWHIPNQFLQLKQEMYKETLNHKIMVQDLHKLKNSNFYNKKIPKKYFILDTHFSNYYVDNTEYIYPLNLYAKNLTINVNLLMVDKNYIQTIYKLLDFFSLKMVFASNLLLYLPYLFYTNDNRVSTFIDVDQDNSNLVIIENNKVVFKKNINYGLKAIFRDTYKSLNINAEKFKNINIENDSFFQLKGKTIQFTDKNKEYNIIYQDFYQSLEKVVIDFVSQINQVLADNNYTKSKNLTFIGDCNSFFMNNIISKQIHNKHDLQNIINKEDKKSNKHITLGDVASISLIKFILASKSNASKINIFYHNIEKLIMGNQN